MSDTVLSLDGLTVRLPKGADRPHALSDVSLGKHCKRFTSLE